MADTATGSVQWARQKLIQWYSENKRDLPWRKSRDPYLIWISEVMLQQTTVTAVIPFYQKFITRFPHVKVLAESTLEDVYEYWAGLGYYSRARNLHKASQIIFEQGFPQTAEKLMELPGFGPYTSCAVASLAFNEPVGVLDGNVIRVLSRFYGLKLKWWEPAARKKFQDLAHELAKTNQNSDLNQGLMELGATICSPKKTMCLLCPWNKKCVAYDQGLVEQLPLSRPKAAGEKWHWTFQPLIHKNKILLQKNSVTPFLTDLQFPPGKAKKIETKPNRFDFKHGVTKYDIFVSVQTPESTVSVKKMKTDGQWVEINQIKKLNPTSLMTKILKYLDKQNKLTL